MKTRFKILPELNLLLRYYHGNLKLQDVLSSLENTASVKNYKPSFDIINDIRDANLNVAEDEVMELVEFIKSNNRIYAKRNSILLTNTPEQVVFGMMVKMFNDESIVNLSVVSTLKSALYKLGIPEEHNVLIENYFKNMKNEI